MSWVFTAARSQYSRCVEDKRCNLQMEKKQNVHSHMEHLYVLRITVTRPSASDKDLYSDLIWNTSRFEKAALP